MNTTTERYVGDIMTRNVLSVGKTDTLTDAIRIMEQESLSVLPVIDRAGKVCGILSTSDLVALTYSLQADVAVLPHVGPIVRDTLIRALCEDCDEVKVASAMTSHVKTVNAQDPVSAAARLMTENAIHHTPVVDERGEPIGILSASDIVRTVAYRPDGLT